MLSDRSITPFHREVLERVNWRLSLNEEINNMKDENMKKALLSYP